MSEFLAEARILVRPDTSRFRTDLEAQLKSVLARPVKIPVIPVVGPGFAAAAAGTTAFTAAQESAAAATAVTADALASATTIQRQYAGAVDLSTVSTNALAAAEAKQAVAASEAAAANAANTRTITNTTKGMFAQTAALFGLRGGTLAASSAFIAGTVGVLAFSKAVKSAASLETSLNVFKEAAKATGDEMERVSVTAQQLGRDLTLPGVSAGDAAETMTLLARAGLSVQDSLGAARGTLQLATAAQISNAEATSLVAGSLNAFALAGEDAIKVADLLAGAANASQGEVEDLGLGLQQVQGTAANFGVSIEDTVTALTALTKTGLSARQAGTGLNVALIRLAANKDARKFVEGLGIAIEDINGNVRPEVFLELGEAMKGMSVQAQRAAIANNFGRDAMKAILPLVALGSKGFKDLGDEVTAAGQAQALSAAKTKGLEGDFSNLSNQLEALGLTFGNVAKGPVSLFVKLVAEQVSVMNDAALGAVALGTGIGDLGKELADAIPFADRLGSRLGDIGKVALFLNPATRSFAIAALAAKQFGVELGDAAKEAEAFKAKVQELFGILEGPIGPGVPRIQIPQIEGLNVKQIENIVEGFDAKAVRDRIAKDNAQLIADLQLEQDFLVGQLQRQFVKNRPALKRALEQNLLGVVNDIQSIQDKAAADAKAAREKAEKAARDAAAAATAREQALLASFGVARDQQQNKIAQEALKAGLQGDIDAQEGLRRLVLKQIAAVKRVISVQGGRVAVITALKAILIQVDAAKAALVKQQLDAQEERRQNLIEAATLDINFFQTTENKAAEINARRKLISQLKAEQALVKAGTLEWKRLRNDIAAQNAAIKALNAERLNQKNLFAQASFDFLQAQQGFASNLLGNLIPTGSTAGLVGATSVSTALPPLANANAAQAQSGFTQGQGQATNGILLRILDQMKLLNGTQAAPEANWQAKQTMSSLDGVGGG